MLHGLAITLIVLLLGTCADCEGGCLAECVAEIEDAASRPEMNSMYFLLNEHTTESARSTANSTCFQYKKGLECLSQCENHTVEKEKYRATFAYLACQENLEEWLSTVSCEAENQNSVMDSCSIGQPDAYREGLENYAAIRESMKTDPTLEDAPDSRIKMENYCSAKMDMVECTQDIYEQNCTQTALMLRNRSLKQLTEDVSEHHVSSYGPYCEKLVAMTSNLTGEVDAPASVIPTQRANMGKSACFVGLVGLLSLLV